MSRSGREGPRPVNDALAVVARDLGLPDPAVIGALLAGWDAIVGEHLALHAHPRSVLRGVMTVAVDDPTWVTPLRYLDEALLERCAALLGEGAVTSVRVVVEGPGAGRERAPRGPT